MTFLKIPLEDLRRSIHLQVSEMSHRVRELCGDFACALHYESFWEFARLPFLPIKRQTMTNLGTVFTMQTTVMVLVAVLLLAGR